MYARIEENVVVEVIGFDPAGKFVGDFVWVDCPDDTRQGATYDGSEFVNPPEIVVEPDPEPEPESEEPAYRSLSFVEFVTLVTKAGQMTDEKAVEILQTSADASIILLRIMLEKAGDAIDRDNVVVQDGLQTLVEKAFITGEGKDAILAAWPQS